MKKILLSLVAFASFGLTVNSYAQLLWSQDFESPTVAPALPASWSQHSTGSPAWVTGTSATEGSTWGSLTGYYNLPAHTSFAVVDAAANPGQAGDTLMSQAFSVSGSAHPYLNYDYFFYAAENNTTHKMESSYILGSSDGGTTWSVIDTLLGVGWGGSWYTQNTDLSSLTGTNCKIAVTYSDQSSTSANTLLGVAIDNIQERNLTADSVGLNSISYNSITNGIALNSTPLAFTVQNYGIPATVTVYYTVNGGTPVSQTFPSSGTIAPFTTQTFTFTTPMSGLVAGTNTIKVAISSVNSVGDTRSDTVKTSTCVPASSDVQRGALVEEFTSSTCPPCASFASSFDPFCNTLNVDQASSNINIIKYQMNWPDWDDDRSYNNDGYLRRTYYNCNSIPEHLVDGIEDNYNWSAPFTAADNAYFTSEFTGHAATKAFMDMSATYTIDTMKKKLNVKVTVTPHFNLTGAYHLYVAVADKHYQNRDNEWGMLDYYNVMRQMFPDGNGTAITSFTDGTSISYTDTNVAYTQAGWMLATTTLSDTTLYPTQMSNTFWGNPLIGGTSPYFGSELIAFVEQDGNKSIMQSIVMPPTQIDVMVSTLSKVDGISVSPNPANDVANVSFNLRQVGNVQLTVVDYSGRVIGDVMNQNMSEGKQNVSVHTENIPSGNYLVMIKTEGGVNFERLVVLKK